MSSIGSLESSNRRAVGSGALYERIVLRALEPMSHGSLELRLPGGSVRRFGQGTNPRGSRYGLAAEIEVTGADFFRRCFYYGDIGFAESFMAGEWNTEDLDEVISWFILNAENSPSLSSERRRRILLRPLGWMNDLLHRLRRNSVAGSRRNISAHYDLSNAFFELFLDPSMTYSSGLLHAPDQTLAEAQEAKYRRICDLLELRGGERVLEIGCGWGAFSRHLVRRYGCKVTAVTISEEQATYARAKIAEEGMEESIELRKVDYRELKGNFDRVVSIEMLEAVGHEFLDTFFAKCGRLLAPNGLLALQVITCPDSRYEAMRRSTDFIQKHIFPGGMIPSLGAIVSSVSRASDLTLRDLHGFGDSYARTLGLWSEAFESRLDEVRALGFDEIFIRKWRYYFAYCRAAFRMRHIDVVQMLLTRPNNHTAAFAPGGHPVR